MIRIGRGSQKTVILQAIAHKSKVLELRIKKPTFVYKPGQYVYLCCPYIADYEWHPFTISSSPDEDYLSNHIRIVGDWTGKLWDLLNDERQLGVVKEDLTAAPNGSPILLVDGPFGAASEDVFRFKNVILFAAGIGVTPFASILKSIKYKIETDDTTTTQHVHFFWSNRDSSCFEWFVILLRELEQECPFLDINLYFTGNLNADQVREMHYATDEDRDAITGLRAKTILGRPNIKQIISDKALEYQGETIGVFFCGPPIISKQLADACRKCTDTKTKTKLIYHKENF
jgi:NADPH oxidase